MRGYTRVTAGAICLALISASCSTAPRAPGNGGSLAAIPAIQHSSLVARGRVVWRDGHPYTEFDIPGADLGTFPYAMDDAGDVAGIFISQSGGQHGFLRAQNGNVTVVDPPGLSRTSVIAMNRSGEIAGFAGGQGFVRDPNGTYTVFSPPGASNTEPSSINESGQVTGFVADAANNYHGFLRNTDGTIIVFDAPGSGATAREGTAAVGINAVGDVVGNFGNASGQHGFERYSDGTFAEFDIPKTLAARPSIYPAAINSAGLIVGAADEESNPSHIVGFVRDRNGRFTLIQVAQAAYPFPDQINDRGQVIGSYGLGSVFDPTVGFLRSPHGNITTIAAPGAFTTIPVGLDHLGRIAGSYIIAALGEWHGFFRL